MKRSTKVTFLVVILAIPAFIFVFLKLFGENTFEVPVYYAQGVDKSIKDCSFPPGQYHVDPTLLPKDGLLQGKLSVVAFVADKKVVNQLERIHQSLSHQSLQVLNICDSSKITHWEEGQKRPLQYIYLNTSKHRQILQCGFVADNEHQLVLVDQLSRIRGYYDAEDWEEVDRLILEIKILLYGTANDA